MSNKGRNIIKIIKRVGYGGIIILIEREYLSNILVVKS